MNGLNIKYTELISSSVKQPFYSNQYCGKFIVSPSTDIKIIPTSECLETMARLDYLFRPIDSKAGFIIFGRVHGLNAAGNNLIRFLPLKGDKLSFWMILENPSLINFDLLPLTLEKTNLFYFSNELTDAAAPRNDLHITKASGGVEISDRVIKSNAFYHFHHNLPITIGSAKLKHVLTGIEIKEFNLINEAGESDLYCNLSSLPQGICKLFINNIEQQTFYFLGNEIPQQLFGVIELSLSELLTSNYRVIEADRSLTLPAPHYSILINNRATKWRYTLELSSISPLYVEKEALSPADKADFIQRLNITSNDTAVTFSALPSDPDGKVFEFVSDTVLPLKEKYYSSSGVPNEILQISLKKYIGIAAKETTVRSDLPCPSTGYIDASDDPNIYSDIFLTI